MAVPGSPTGEFAQIGKSYLRLWLSDNVLWRTPGAPAPAGFRNFPIDGQVVIRGSGAGLLWRWIGATHRVERTPGYTLAATELLPYAGGTVTVKAALFNVKAT